MNLRKKYIPVLLATTLVISALTITTSEATFALKKKGDSLIIDKNKKIDPDGALSKLEIISAVREIYSGKILSVRKKEVENYSDCHHVRFINKQGDFLQIKVQCE